MSKAEKYPTIPYPRPGGVLPGHVAIIMDGNGRWASRKGLPRIAGHKAGEESITEIIRVGSEWELEALSLFAFSTENWNRPRNEIDFLMSFNRNLLRKRMDEFHARNIRVRHYGRRRPIPDSTLEEIDRAVEMTRDNTGTALNIAFNYGGRGEVVDGAVRMGKALRSGEVSRDELNEESFHRFLYGPEVSDPDILIRTAGEMRISNFLLYQTAYTELYFTETLWPDFRAKHLAEAITYFQGRARRMGNV
jgi:undecaprenyl diphosphate synthase